MRHGSAVAVCLAVGIFGASPSAFAVPVHYNVRYEFTTDAMFLSMFGVQATVSGVARYSLDAVDQLPDESHQGTYSLISHRIQIDGIHADAQADPFGADYSNIAIINDIGWDGPPPHDDMFAIDSTFNQAFGSGLTLLHIAVVFMGPNAITSDQLLRLNPDDFPDQQGILSFAHTGQHEQIGIFAFGLNSIRVTPVPEPGTIALLGLGLAGLGLSRRRKTERGSIMPRR